MLQEAFQRKALRDNPLTDIGRERLRRVHQGDGVSVRPARQGQGESHEHPLSVQHAGEQPLA